MSDPYMLQQTCLSKLLHIYEQLSGRERLKLLNFAVELEEGTKE